MSNLLELQNKLQDTTSTIAHLERRVGQDPNDVLLRLSLESLVKRFKKLQSEFNEITRRQQIDICEYVIFGEADERLSLSGFSSALHEFQRSFSSLYDAIKNGPKQRTRLSANVVRESSLGFGYAYSGSLGFVLTIDRELMLMDLGHLTDAITTFFRLAEAPTKEDVGEIGKQLGSGPLRSIQRWADAHVTHGTGADISWRHQGDTTRVVLERYHMQGLRDRIEETSSEERQVIVLDGVLTGASIETRKFDFRPDGADTISGHFTDAISEMHEVRIPNARYRATVERVSTYKYSSEQETIRWNLRRIEEI